MKSSRRFHSGNPGIGASVLTEDTPKLGQIQWENDNDFMITTIMNISEPMNTIEYLGYLRIGDS